MIIKPEDIDYEFDKLRKQFIEQVKSECPYFSAIQSRGHDEIRWYDTKCRKNNEVCYLIWRMECPFEISKISPQSKQLLEALEFVSHEIWKEEVDRLIFFQELKFGQRWG